LQAGGCLIVNFSIGRVESKRLKVAGLRFEVENQSDLRGKKGFKGAGRDADRDIDGENAYAL
jgi:hypothetical protein